jgi:hypothetical protein
MKGISKRFIMEWKNKKLMADPLFMILLVLLFVSLIFAAKS